VLKVMKELKIPVDYIAGNLVGIEVRILAPRHAWQSAWRGILNV
jgi:hypothetical protein